MQAKTAKLEAYLREGPPLPQSIMKDISSSFSALHSAQKQCDTAAAEICQLAEAVEQVKASDCPNL